MELEVASKGWWSGIGGPRNAANNGVHGSMTAILVEHSSVLFLEELSGLFFTALGDFLACPPQGG